MVAGGVWLFPGGVSGCSRGGMCGCSGGQVVPGRGTCVVIPGGGMHGCSQGGCVMLQGACMVAPGGQGDAWLLPGGCAWLLWGVCMVAPGGHAWDYTRYGQ